MTGTPAHRIQQADFPEPDVNQYPIIFGGVGGREAEVGQVRGTAPSRTRLLHLTRIRRNLTLILLVMILLMMANRIKINNSSAESSFLFIIFSARVSLRHIAMITRISSSHTSSPRLLFTTQLQRRSCFYTMNKFKQKSNFRLEVIYKVPVFDHQTIIIKIYKLVLIELQRWWRWR
jgi:hypothetical protein